MAEVLIVDDDEMLRGAIRAYLGTKGYSVREASTGKACLQALEMDRPDAVLMDHHLPDTNAMQLLREVHAIDPSVPVIVITGQGTIDLAVRAIKEGAEQFVTKPVELAVLSKMLECVLERGRQKRKQLAGQASNARYKRNPFLGTSAAMRSLEEAVGRFLNSQRTILIEGETGTGKGVLASWMHKNGPRADEPFVDLNCAGLNRELLESELFGHEKGAFTGATTAKPGIMEVAHRGTLFLDEIGDMDPLIQPRLLKVLEEKRFRRVGDVRDRSVDVQLIAATHRDLAALVAEGKFRNDLYFRVNTIQLRIPPLRERVEDIPVLADWFLRHLEADLNRGSLGLADGVMQALQGYSWPGNIREFRNVLERAALLCDGKVIQEKDLIFQLGISPSKAIGVEPGGDLTLEELERRHIALVLQRVNGKVEEAAGKLGIPRSTLYAKIKQYNLTLTA
jgi:DNA-binding NtrC family response regulator